MSDTPPDDASLLAAIEAAVRDEKYVHRRVPIPWYQMHDELQKLLASGQPTVSFSRAVELATSVGLPVGAHIWMISASSLGKPTGKEGRTLTVGLLVRPPLPSPAACASLPSAHRCAAWPREPCRRGPGRV